MKKMIREMVTFIVFVLFILNIPMVGKPYQEEKGDILKTEKLLLETGVMIRKSVVVNAGAYKVFDVWTTLKGIKSFFAPDARIELAINGTYEIYFDPGNKQGNKGSEGCKILSFVPGEMLSFTWNQPPSIPAIRHNRTWVVIHFTPVANNQTRVDVTHLGWGAGPDWQEALKYFDRAWEIVLGRLQYRFQSGPIDWKNPFTPR